MYDNGYVPPILTVDAVIFRLHNGKLEVLLLERAKEPFTGMRALPGGYIAAGETTRQAMDRVLKHKTGVSADQLALVEQLYTFDTVARDPRGHAVSVTYMGLGESIDCVATADTQQPAFFPVDALPATAYDHAAIINYALERLQAKIGYTNAMFALLPARITLTQLQVAYETILGKPLDKRNFRKKVLALGMLHETTELFSEGAHRPAKLYTWAQPKLTTFARIFD